MFPVEYDAKVSLERQDTKVAKQIEGAKRMFRR
jgi:hypothetical protein